MGPPAPCQAYGQAGAVFVGSVISVRTLERNPSDGEANWNRRIFKFSVEQSFLGVQGREVEVATGMGGGDCGYGFNVGERYVVYAYRENDRFVTGICTRTAPYSKADKDLEFLRTLSTLAPGVTISGEVKKNRLDVAAGDARPVGPLPNLPLIIEGNGSRGEYRTDANGRYRVTGLQPGTYKVTLQLPDELTTDKSEQEVTLADRGCGVVSYYVVDNGRVSGTIVDGAGQPAAKVLVALVEADHVDVEKDWNLLERTDEKGQYNFSSVPPGRYLLAINFTRFPEAEDATNAFPRTFYPGVTNAKEAEVITLGAGEVLRDKDLRLPERRAPSVISGKVVWDDGQPVAKGGISFRDVTYHDPGMDNGVSTDEQGYFTIKGYVGQTFVIAARSNQGFSPDPRKERSDPVRLTLAKPTEFVKIVIVRVK
jgi:hypothetical protein